MTKGRPPPPSTDMEGELFDIPLDWWGKIPLE